MANKEFIARNGLIVGSNVFVVNASTNTVSAVGTINASAIQVNGATIPSGATSNLVFTTVNAAFGVANVAYGNANNLAVSANAYSGAMANSVNAYTTATYVKLTAGQQTITGDVSIAGNLSLLGSSTIISSNNLSVGDSLIYLAANNYSGTDILDIGFIANYGNTTGANVHTGLVRDATDKQYYLFNAYDKEPANNTFVPGGNNMVNAVLVADFNTSNLTLGGANAISWIKSAYDTVNAAYTSSNADYVVSNAAFGFANGVSTNTTAAFGHSNLTYNSVNSAFGVVNSAYTLANADQTRLSAAYVVANAAFGVANTVTNYLPLAGGTMTGALNIGQSTNLSFGSQVRQMINLWSTSYGIGVQSATQYFRTGTRFSWHRGGIHSDTENDPGTGGTLAMTLDGSSHLTAYGSMRSPIFYDSDNTGYYVDPNSSSKISGLITFDTAYGASKLVDGAGFVINGNYTNGQYSHRFRKWDDTNGVPLYVQFTSAVAGTWTNIAKFGPGGSGETAEFSVFGYGYASGSWRAPIFYDSDNTGYYVDPNSYSNLYTFGGFRNIVHTQTGDWAADFRSTPASYDSWGQQSTGGPSGTWWFMQNMRHSNGTNYWGRQLAWGWEDNLHELYTRNISGNSFTSWYRFWNSYNAPGTVLQVQSTAKTSTTSISVGGNSWNEFDSAFRVTITPKSSSSKILVSAHITGAQNTGTVRYKFQYSTNSGSTWNDVTPIGDAVSNRSRGHFGYAVNGDTNQFNTCSMELLHSPATTSAIIYRIQFGQDISTTYHFNRSINYPDNFLGGTMTSIITAKEIAA